ncbi:MAG: archaetidylserine decarboxylase [Woeseiaceae bacterium]|nr:archaetidylserine decarboxylase [Woeseiaceae bacterium]
MTGLFAFFQYLLPKHLLTAIVYRIARIRHPATKNFLIEKFIRVFDVNVDEIRDEVPDAFATFNDFFVRELSDGERPVDSADDTLVSPVDGTLSIAGHIENDVLVQAKGIDYTLDELLATDLANAHAYDNGQFATIYLAPYNYHRVHAPLAGKLVAARYVPGDLFSVNEATVSRVPKLFRRNERLVMHFETAIGPMALVFVGALNVGSISTPWTGEIRPRSSGVVEVLDLSAHTRHVSKGDLLGWFNMGSTVIVLLPKNGCVWSAAMRPSATVRMGEAIATLPIEADD